MAVKKLVKKHVEAVKVSLEKVPEPVKTDLHCVHDACYEPKAPGQTHVCAKHIRT